MDGFFTPCPTSTMRYLLTLCLLPTFTAGFRRAGHVSTARWGWQGQRVLSSRHHSTSSSGPASNEQNHRFWTREFEIPCSKLLSSAEVISSIEQAVRLKQLVLPAAVTALILVPQHGLIIPMHNGQMQSHHATISTALSSPADGTNLQITVCGFHPRASNINEGQAERPVDPVRRDALDAALLKAGGTQGADLLTGPYTGSSASRIYRSFICPHAKAVFTAEPVERAAGRAVKQIELSLRQLQADRSEHLRNTDRSAPAALTKHPIVLVLDNIRSAHNVGSMFRTAETAGLSEVVTCGITAHPPHPKLLKTAISACQTVSTRHFDSIHTAISTLRAEGYTVVVMETSSRSQAHTAFAYPKNIAIVVGNEITGVDAQVIEHADVIAEIPTYGCKNSLNVASAAPIVIYEVLRQWTSEPKAITTGPVS